MKVVNCYQELLDVINESHLKEDLQIALKEIEKDKELNHKIKEYHQTKNATIRKEIYQNEKYKHYKKLENRLNKLILQINAILGELKNESN